MDSSDSSAGEKRRDRSPSEEKHQTNKLFITNIDGKVREKLLREISRISRMNLGGTSKNTESSTVLWPSETETLNTVLPLLT